MGTTQKLSPILLELGFFSALGTTEHPGLSREGQHVKRAVPNTADYNNGIVVVYDEEGRPWIMRGVNMTNVVHETLRSFDLTQGAYVPHSNDGGYFVHEVMEKL